MSESIADKLNLQDLEDAAAYQQGGKRKGKKHTKKGKSKKGKSKKGHTKKGKGKSRR